MVVKFDFNCPKCGLLVEYDMMFVGTPKNSTDQICKCPQCKTIILYKHINLQPRKKGKIQKCLFTYLNAKTAKKKQK